MPQGTQGYVRESLPEDCQIIADNMRQADVEEIRASHNWSPIEAMQAGFIYSEPPFTVIQNPDIPVAMWGVVPEFDEGLNRGRIWLLGTPGIKDVRVQFLRECSHWIRTATRGYDVVYNTIDKRNKLHIRWLKWLGFSFVREIPDHGYEQRPFLEFVRII